MRFIKFILALAITAGLTYWLNHSQTVGGNTIPPLGKFLNPVSGVWANAEPIAKFQDETYDFPDLSAPVQVIYDKRLVPHIFAQNMSDAFFVQGYVTAQHRLWQMDFTARSAAGRLSEVLGERTLEFDKLRRNQAMPLAATNAVKGWKKAEDFVQVEQYIHGANAYINSLRESDFPIEFKLLDYQPETWTAEKLAYVVKSMALVLCFRADDLEATNALNTFGRETFDFLYPEWNPKQSPIIPVGTKFDWKDTINVNTQDTDNEAIGAIPLFDFDKPDEGLGSNNWAVNGNKTASGNPILCNDPHLTLSLPSVWYELQIHTPDFNAYGVTFPGIPGILIGFNEDVAWGVTNVGHDVLDWYQMKWANAEQTKYLYDGETVDVETWVDTIFMKGGGYVLDTIQFTKYGPIVYSNPNDAKQSLAMHWVGHEVPKAFEFATFVNLNKAKNYDEYVDALVDYGSPAQNFAFASKEGDIAMRVNGQFPLKRKEQGRFVQAGSTSKNDWQGFIPKAQVPSMKNPSRNFVASANQHSTDPTYPYYYNGGFADFRGRYLNRKLEEMEKITVEDMMALQTNNHSIKAEEAVKAMLKNIPKAELNTTETAALNVLEKWDFRYDNSKRAPVLFELWWAMFYEATWDEIWAKNSDESPQLQPEVWRTIALMEDDPNSIYWDKIDTEARENLSTLILQTFKKTLKKYEVELLNPAYDWGAHHQTNVQHLARLSPFSRLTSPNGTKSALNANGALTGPSWRMIVELGEQTKAWGVYPGGQSGNPGSYYYDNMVSQWESGEYNELLFMRDTSDVGEGLLYKAYF